MHTTAEPVKRETFGIVPVAEDLILENCHIMGETKTIENGSLYLSEGKIHQISRGSISSEARRIDCTGLTVMAGLIDLHSDALEKYIEPRPGSVFPIETALQEFDKTLVAQGITTMFYCIAFVGEDKENRSLRQDVMAHRIIDTVVEAAPRLKCRPQIHLRYDLLHFEGIPGIVKLIKEGKISLLSFMDHTPGQGQYRDIEKYKKHTAKVFGVNTEGIEERIDRLTQKREAIDQKALKSLAGLCRTKGIPLASHDDDSFEKLDWAESLGLTLSEFPISLDVLEEAKRREMATMVGSPNILLGRSHSNNLSALEAISSGHVDIICSDYSPLSLFHSLFVVEKKLAIPLEEISKYATINPARAAGLDNERGSIAEGKSADLILFDRSQEIPQIAKTLVMGREVFTTN